MAVSRWQRITSVVQLILQSGEFGEFIQFLELAVRLVTHQRPVEVDGKHNENQAKGDHDCCGGDGGCLPRRDSGSIRWRAVACGLLLLQREELHPAQEDYFGQEQESPDDSGKGPGQLDMSMHALVRGLLDGVEVVHVADGFDVWEDAGADHEGKEMHSHQHGGASTESDQEPLRIIMVSVQLHFHHSHLGKGVQRVGKSPNKTKQNVHGKHDNNNWGGA